jgi:heme/copper-type cytochrome/quinol oxidase subunit 4
MSFEKETENTSTLNTESKGITKKKSITLGIIFLVILTIICFSMLTLFPNNIFIILIGVGLLFGTLSGLRRYMALTKLP